MRVMRGKPVIEDLIVDEISHFFQILDKYADQKEECDFDGLLGPSIANNIAFLLFGHRFGYNDPVKITSDNNFETFTKIIQFAGIPIFLPLLGKIFAKLGFMNYREAKKCFNDNNDYFSKEIHQHLQEYCHHRDEPPIDYIDGYLKEKYSRQARGRDRAHGNGRDGQLFDTKTLNMNLGVFFVAGSETVKATLCGAILFLLKYPDYQERVRDEIDSVFGPHRTPWYGDRGLLQYTMAFLNEAARYGSVLAVSALRQASKNVQISAHFIPKDIIVSFNFFAIHHDPNLWNNPEEFNPERFLTDNGSRVTKPSYLVPFSGGKRVCPGEAFAQMEVFLYLTLILQRYRIKTAENSEISTEAEFELTRRPKYFPSLVLERISE